MPKFQYEGVTAQGQKTKGEFEAANQASAMSKLKAQQIKPTLVKEKSTTGLKTESLAVANFRKLLHGFRQRFGELVREEITRLVSDPSEVDHELAHLMKVLS